MYGDGQLVSEYYLESKPSVLNNGTIKVDNEIPDAELIKFFGAEEVVVPLQDTKVTTPSGNLKLKDGNEYPISDINAQLLEKIGYTPKEIGKLLKAIC